MQIDKVLKNWTTSVSSKLCTTPATFSTYNGSNHSLHNERHVKALFKCAQTHISLPSQGLLKKESSDKNKDIWKHGMAKILCARFAGKKINITANESHTKTCAVTHTKRKKHTETNSPSNKEEMYISDSFFQNPSGVAFSMSSIHASGNTAVSSARGRYRATNSRKQMTLFRKTVLKQHYESLRTRQKNLQSKSHKIKLLMHL